MSEVRSQKSEVGRQKSESRNKPACAEAASAGRPAYDKHISKTTVAIRHFADISSPGRH